VTIPTETIDELLSKGLVPTRKRASSTPVALQ
jgi:hypothetical protein